MKMPLLILDSPNFLSGKLIGISLMEHPAL